MMNQLKITLIAVASILFVYSCKSQYDTLLNSNDADAKYKAAFEYFNNNKYQKAAALFESLAVLTNGTDRDDTVRYYWWLSNYRYGDFYTAETNFAKFAEIYPRSGFTEDARFLRLDCLYRATLRYELDPSPTYAAINAINEYVRDYPATEHSSECAGMLKDLGDRLDKKAYEAAKLYYNMEDYKASRVAFKNILKDDADNIYREDILYYIAKSSYKYANLSVLSKQKERYLTFIDDYLNFIGELPDSPYRKELDVLYSRVQKSIGNYAGIDTGEDNMSDRDLEKARKEAERLRKKSGN